MGLKWLDMPRGGFFATIGLFLLTAVLMWDASAQSVGTTSNNNTFMTGSATSATTLLTVANNNYGSVYFSFSSVGGGGIFTTELSVDNGANWIGFGTTKINVTNSTPSVTWNPTTSDVWVGNLQPGAMWRIRITSYVSGTVTVNANFRPDPAPTFTYVQGIGGALVVGGTNADDAAASGNPVPVGGIYNATLPGYTTGDRTQLQSGPNGELRSQIVGSLSSGADGIANSSAVWATRSGSQTSVGQLIVGPQIFNGSTWDREFTCPSSAVVNVAAAATTQLVALAASQIIRVCSFVITGDTAATTATFVYGTGANCGTGQVALTGAMRMVDEGSLAISGANGSLFRTAASNALCLTAATGAVTGFVTYAIY